MASDYAQNRWLGNRVGLHYSAFFQGHPNSLGSVIKKNPTGYNL